MEIVRGIMVSGVAAAVVLVAYVVDGLTGGDLGSAATAFRIVVILAAVVVAIVAFQSWSHGSTPHTISAMVLGLLGGASLASTVTTATDDGLYGSAPMALVGTVAVIASVLVAQIGRTRSKESAR